MVASPSVLGQARYSNERRLWPASELGKLIAPQQGRGSVEASRASRLDPEEIAGACRVGPGHIRRPPDAPLKHLTLENILRFQAVRVFEHASATSCRVKPFCCGQ